MQTKVGRLLQIIPARGDKAFGELIKALIATQQEHLAKELDADLTQYVADGDQEEVVDAGTAAVAIPEKSVDEKVSEIRM